MAPRGRATQPSRDTNMIKLTNFDEKFQISDSVHIIIFTDQPFCYNAALFCTSYHSIPLNARQKINHGMLQVGETIYETHA